MDMATLNTRIGWPSTYNSSLGWFGDNTKPAYRSYGLENMAGYYWYHLNISDDGGFYAYNCNCAGGNYLNYATVNCCQDTGGVGGNCACNCNSNCGTLYNGQCVNCTGNPNCAYTDPPNGFGEACACNVWNSGASGYAGRDSGVNCVAALVAAPANCGQCYITGNCDSRTWFQPNCNCIQCDCACNCGQCAQCAQCAGSNGNCWTECANCWVCACACMYTCFPAGTPVLMADLTWKPVEQVAKGEYVWTISGPALVVRPYITKLGDREMLRFTDKSLQWSSEHPIWARNKSGDEWLWTYDPEKWRREVTAGAIGGLKDNYSIWTGDAVEFAHIDGFRKNSIEVLLGYSPETPLYAVITEGPMVVTGGYLVAAGTNEFNFDYTITKWEEQRPRDVLPFPK
jgi:hypothetical protein